MGRLLEFGAESSIEKLVDMINRIVENNFDILKEDADIEKWNTLPKLLLLKEEEQQKILAVVEYLDSSYISLEDKIDIIISLSGLINIVNLSVMDYDLGNLFMLANYCRNGSINEIKNSFEIIKESKLLLAIRRQTLDIEIRQKILLMLVNRAFYAKINTANKQEVDNFITQVIKELEEKGYEELLK